MREVKRYKVFSKSHQLAVEIHKTVAKFPKEETFGLISQMRHCAYSIPMNLVEGGARCSSEEFCPFINIALGSCEEIRYQLLLAKDLGYFESEKYEYFENEYVEAKKMLSVLYRKIKHD